MVRYCMGDGTVLDTDNATNSWAEDTSWDGHNRISAVTGSEWIHQTLYLSREGRYYLETSSQWQGSPPSAEWVNPRTAASWLLANAYAVPGELEAAVDQVSE